MNIQKIKKKYDREVADESITVTVACMALSLNNLYGFGTKRTNKLIDQMTKDMACIAGDYLPEKELYKWCRQKKINI